MSTPKPLTYVQGNTLDALLQGRSFGSNTNMTMNALAKRGLVKPVYRNHPKWGFHFHRWRLTLGGRKIAEARRDRFKVVRS